MIAHTPIQAVDVPALEESENDCNYSLGELFDTTSPRSTGKISSRHIVSEKGIEPDERKVKAIQEFPIPTKQKDVQSFLGLANYYRKFIKDFSKIAKPLFDISCSTAEFKWSTEQENSFKILKDKLSSTEVLKPFDANKTTILTTDASGSGLGAVLSQEDVEGNRNVVEFASRTLRKNEEKYGASELECLALVWACVYFRHYLLGIFFIAETDHSSLQWLVSLNNPSGRLARWAISLAEYNFEIRYRPGCENKVADIYHTINECKIKMKIH